MGLVPFNRGLRFSLFPRGRFIVCLYWQVPRFVPHRLPRNDFGILATSHGPVVDLQVRAVGRGQFVGRLLLRSDGETFRVGMKTAAGHVS
jgi:hypothetical protein